MIAFRNGHTRGGALSADTVDARLVQTDAVDAGVLDAPTATFNFLTVGTSATFAGAVVLAGATTLAAGATVSGAAVFQDSVTVDAGAAVAVNSPTTFGADVVVAAGRTLTVDGVDVTAAGGTLSVAGRLAGGDTAAGDIATATISGAPTFTAGATIAPGETLDLAGATLPSSNVAFPDGFTIAAGQTLACGTGVFSNWVFDNGLVIAPGATLAMGVNAGFGGNPTATDGLTVAAGQSLGFGAGAAVAGPLVFSGGTTVSPAQTLTFTGATLAGGGSGAMTGLNLLNTVRANTVLGRRYGAPVPVPAGRVFPTFRPPANPTGVFVIDATSFSGQASNGTNSGGVYGANLSTTGARATAVDNTDCVLQDFICFNRSPYTFFLLNNTFQNTADMSPISNAWYPLTTLRCSRTSFPAGSSTLWKATAQPLRYVSGWGSLNPALLTSADCTLDLYRHQYSVVVANSSNAGRTGVEVTGQLLIHFTTAAPTDPVRIQVPLPVGAIAETAYPAVSGFTPRCGVFRDWVLSSGNSFNDSLPFYIGGGELARASGTYARSDATAQVAAYIEPGNPNAGYMRVVASGFTGGAGTYKLRCNYRVPMENVVFRPTFDTFSYVV